MELTSDSSVSAPLGLMQHSSSSDGCSSVGNGGVGCIVHTVTKLDTLAGVAIKYGVEERFKVDLEVADVKRMNGLTTDLQMFARKSLQIPSPGRHPPSPVMTNGYHTQGLMRFASFRISELD
ncbi:putative LysM domain-containing protein [Helianthus annuus]|nr:putative LysM domain-containing protein [Helianthus annuus]